MKFSKLRQLLLVSAIGLVVAALFSGCQLVTIDYLFVATGASTISRRHEWSRRHVGTWFPRTSAVGHFVGRNPTILLKLGFDLFPSHFFCNIGNSNPEKANWGWTVSSFVIDREFNLIGLIDIDIVDFLGPLVCSSGPGFGSDVIFHFHDDKGFGASGETRGGSVIDIFDGVNSHFEMTGQWLPHVWGVETIIYRECQV